MESKFLVPGMIIVARDNCRPYSKFADKPSTHPYLILSMNDDNKDMGYAQCMRITSMKYKEMESELPIILGDSITFVVPYNIHSFPVKSLNIDSYKGFISPGFMSTGDFIELLMDIYKCNICSSLSCYDKIAKDNIADRIMSYQVEFLEKYKDYPYYRDKFTEASDVREDNKDPEEHDTSSIGMQIIKTLEEPKTDDELSSDHVDAVVDPSDSNGLTISSTDDGIYKIVNCKGETVTRTRQKMRYLGNSNMVNFIINCEDGTIITLDGRGMHADWTEPYPKFVLDAIKDEHANKIKDLEIAVDKPEVIKAIKFLDKCPRNIKSFDDNQLAAAFKVLSSYADNQIARSSNRWNSATAVRNFRNNFYERIQENPFQMEFHNPSNKRKFIVEIPTAVCHTYQNKKEVETMENLLPVEVRNTLTKCRELFPSVTN